MRKNRKYTAEIKIECIRLSREEHLSNYEIAKRMNISDESRIRAWLQKYQNDGETYFYEEHRGKGAGNRYAALHTKKNLSKEERLELENLKLRIENERLKKGYQVKGVGANKEFVTTKDVNMKS